MRYRTLIIENEHLTKERLKQLLQTQAGIDLLETAADKVDGFRRIEQEKPDLIFMDLQLLSASDLETLQQLNFLPFIVFITSHDEEVLPVLQKNSMNYLLKPLKAENLQRVIKTFLDTSTKRNDREERRLQMGKLANQLDQQRKIHTLSVNIGKSVRLVQVEKVTHLLADDKYVQAFEQAGKMHLVSCTLTELQERLPDNFLRIHRSTIINRDYVLEVHQSVKGRLIFSIGDGAGEVVNLSCGVTYGSGIRKQLGI